MGKQNIVLGIATFLALQLCTFSAVAIDQSKKKTASESTQAEKAVVRAEQRLTGWRGNPEDLVAAKADIDLALSLSPSYPPAYKELARYYIMAGHINSTARQPGSLEAAESALKKATLIDPSYVGAYVLSGHLYLKMNRPEEAKSALRKADQLGTTDPWLQLNWADLLMAEGKIDEAAERYRKVIDSRTENKKAMGSAFEGLIRYNLARGNLDQASSLYQKQINYEPTNAWAYGNYANFLLCARDDFNEAITQGKKAISLMDYGMGRFILGAAYYRKWAQLTLSNASAAERKTNWDNAVASYPDVGSLVGYEQQCPPVSSIKKALLATKSSN